MSPRRGQLAPFLLLLVLAPSEARAGEIERLLGELGARGKGLSSFRATFVQRKRLALFKNEIQTQGEVVFSRPDKLRWETFAPDPMVVLVRGQAAELRAPGQPRRTIDLARSGAVASVVEQMLVWFGVRPPDLLLRDYQVSIQGKRPLSLRLVPRDPKLRQHVASIEVELGRDQGARKVQVVQADGDRTTIEFSAIQRNLLVPAALFR